MYNQQYELLCTYTTSTVRVRNDSRALQLGLRLVDQLELAKGYVGVGEHGNFIYDLWSGICHTLFSLFYLYNSDIND
jgi:hypothetical protein